MPKRQWKDRVLRLAITVAIGGTAFQASGCDPTVRGTLLTGLEQTSQTLGSALISAFFLSLEDDPSGGLTTTSP